jgi:WD40 repeat protein
VNAVVFSPADDGSLASASEDGEVRLWDLRGVKPSSGVVLRMELKPPATNKAQGRLTYSSDGKLLAFAPGGLLAVRVWDLSEAPPRARGEIKSAGAGAVHTIRFAPNREVLAVGTQNNQVQLWDLLAAARGQALSVWETGAGREIVSEASKNFQAVAFAPSGRTLAASGSYVVVLQLGGSADRPKAGVGESPRQPGFVRGVAFAPDGRHLATANGNGAVYILRLAEPGAARPHFPAHGLPLGYGVSEARRASGAGMVP